jgi:site-specific DNA-cytosine methylase
MGLSEALRGWGDERGEFARDFEDDDNFGQPHPAPRSAELTAVLNSFGNDSSDDVREEGSHEDGEEDSGENSDDRSTDKGSAEDINNAYIENEQEADETYEAPAWATAQWKKLAKGNIKPAALTRPSGMNTGGAKATALFPALKNRPEYSTGIGVLSHGGHSSVHDVDDNLLRLLGEAVPSLSSNRPRFFGTNGPPPSIAENISKRQAASTNGLNKKGPPMSNIYEIFDDMADKAVERDLCERLPSRKLRIFTMCSGTEAPLLAMQLMQRALARRDQPILFSFEHLASAELEPFKQAFIQRNFNPPVLFRDVTEFSVEGHPHTAYGGTAPQPENVDILIAGTVCKDYSTLNNDKKKFGESGKSYNTFVALARYADRNRPKIIILENVSRAPWWQIRNHLGAIGYEGVAVQVDTKNFYLPQTRERGYLIAFDTRRYPSSKFDVESVSQDWKDCMQYFQRRATSPFTDFLLADDDPYLHQAKLGALTFKSKKANQAWDACRHRYAKWRVENQTGMLRPLTKWQTNGTCVFPDFGWILWAKRQRERIWDTLEIEFLRHAGERDYDMNYKCRWLELSQNVDRAGDKTQWGVVGCLTPSGLPYLTTRGGPVIGKELLSLQGMPIDDLDLNKEKMPQLQNLAGNAMSTPVIGAAIFSAIMAAQKRMHVPNTFFEKESRKRKREEESHDLSGVSTQDQDSDTNRPKDALASDELWKSVAKSASTAHLVTTSELLDLSTKDLQQLAGKTIQLCECETVPGMKLGVFQICRLCGHTACSICAGSPQHLYENIAPGVIKKRLDSSQFVEKISDALPAALQLSRTDSIWASLNEDLRKAVKLACTSPVTFRHVKPGPSWKVTFESFHAVLELHFARKCNPEAASGEDFFAATAIDCYWLLFAKPDSKLDVSDHLREELSQPIARMDPDPRDSLLNGEWKTPRFEGIQLSIKPLANNAEWTPAWETRLGIQRERFRGVEVPNKQVVHVLSSPSRAAKIVTSALEGEYLLLPHCGGASGSLHVRHEHPPMFFYRDPEQLKNAIYDRYVFAETHHRLGYKETRIIHAKVVDEWTPPIRRRHQDTVEQHPPEPAKVEICVWKVHPLPSLGAYEPSSPPQMVTPPKLGSFVPIATACKATPPSIMLLHVPLLKGELEDRRGQQFPVPLFGKIAVLQQFGWVIKRAILKIPDIGEWQPVGDLKDLDKACLKCVPTAPGIEYGKDPRGKLGHKKPREAREKAEEAVNYEGVLRTRPQPFTATMHCYIDSVILDVKLNLPTIIHRLAARFSTLPSINADLTMDWRLSKDEGQESLPIFKLKPLQNNNNEVPIEAPEATFVKDKERPLWQEQQRAVAWMVNQERKPCDWHEREREEICVPGIGLRLDVKASLQKEICGGVLADEVGGGKTTTSFALIAHMFNEPRQFPPDPRFINLEATLILVPANLLKQWEEESEKCYGKGPDKKLSVLVIANATKLMETALSKLKKQHIIIAPWNIFDESSYWTNLAGLSGARNKPADPGRAFQQWLREALKDSRELVELTGGSETHRQWQTFTPKNVEKYEDFQQVAGKAPSKIGFRPLFHLFRFQRLIVDEYSYLEGCSFLAILELIAMSKWMLSGTPPLTSFDDVNTTAKLIGTQLSGEDENDGYFSFVTHGAKVKKAQTETEEFQSYQNRHSAAWYEARYAIADDFVDKFIRKNSRDRPDRKPSVELLRPKSLSAMEQVTYLEVYQRLMSQSTAFNLTYTSEDLTAMSRHERLGASISMSRGPEDALLSCCSDMQASMRECAVVVGEKSQDVVYTIGKLYAALREVFGYASTRTDDEDPEQKNSHFLSYKLRIYNKDFGDESATALVDMVMYQALQDLIVPLEPFPAGLASKKGEAKKRHSTIFPKTIAPRPLRIGKEDPKAEKDSVKKEKDAVNNEKKVRKAEMKSRAEDLNTRSLQLVDQVKSLRFFQMVSQALSGKPMPKCAGCLAANDAANTYIIGTCGHIACYECLHSEDRLRNGPDGCIFSTCSATALPHHIIQASRFSADSVSPHVEAGSKMSAVVKEVQGILHETNEKILIFVQLPRVATALIQTLSQNIDEQLTDATGVRSATGGPFCGPVEEFRKGRGGRICVLLLESADAAGW